MGGSRSVGAAIFEVIPEFKQFQKELFAGVDEAAKKVSKDASGVEIKADTSQIESAFKRLGDLGRVVAGIAVVAALKNAVDSGREYASTVANIARVSGDSLEESSRLAFVLDRIGITAERAAPGIVILNRNIEQGGANFKKYFDAATLAELRTSSFSERLPILAKAYQDLNTASEKSTFIQNTFGRGGAVFAKLLALQTDELKALGDEAARFGLILDETNVGAFRRYAQSSRAAEQASLGLKVAVGDLTLPIFEAFDKAAISVLTTLTSLPAPVQALIGVFGIGAIGIGKYAQTLTALVDIGKGVAAAIGRIIAARSVEIAGTAASTAAANLEAAAQSAAAAAKVRSAQASLALGGAASEAAVAQGTSAALAAAGPAAAAGGAALGVIATASLAGVIAAGGIIIAGALDKALSDAREREAIINAGNKERVAAIRAGGGDDADIAAATAELAKLKEEGLLTDDAIRALSDTANLVQMKKIVEQGGDLPAFLREIATNASDGVDSLEELGATVGDFASEIGALREASIEQKAAQADLSEALRRTGVDTEAGTNVLANYAQRLFEIKQAEQGFAAGSEEAAKARREASEEALKAADDFLAKEKEIAQAIKDGQEKVAEAEKRLQEVRADGIKRVAEAEKNLRGVAEDNAERRLDAEEHLAEVRKSGRKDVRDAVKRLEEAEIASAERIVDAERAVAEAKRNRSKAIGDAQQSVEAAQRSGDLEAENAAREALQQAQQDKSVAEAERGLAREKKDREKEIADLRKGIHQAEIQAAKDVKDAEEDLADVIEDNADRIKDATDKVTEAQLAAQDAIIKAQTAVRDANEEAAEAIEKLTGTLEPAVVAFQRLKKEAEEFEAVLLRIKQSGVLGGGSSTDLVIANNAEGGPVHAGDWSFVGEKGMELRRFGSPGQIVSNADIVSAIRELGGVGGSSGPSVGPVHITTGNVDPRLLANELAFRLMQGVR